MEKGLMFRCQPFFYGAPVRAHILGGEMILLSTK